MTLLAATISYTGFLVIGVLADYLGSSRFVAGLLLGALFARFPRVSNGKLGMVGLVPKPVRQPLMAGLLALCLLRFLAQGEVVPALFAGFTMAFVLGFSWLRKWLFARAASSVFNVAGGRNKPVAADNSVIDGEFRELKD